MKKPRKTSTTKKRPYIRRKATLPPCDKWIIGMVVLRIGGDSFIKMFERPKVHTTYDSAVRECEALATKHGQYFVVFAKKLVMGPSRPPIVATEFAT